MSFDIIIVIIICSIIFIAFVIAIIITYLIFPHSKNINNKDKPNKQAAKKINYKKFNK